VKRYSYGERDYAFGQMILTLRTIIGLTQAGLADQLGVSRRAVAEWEAGLSYPKAERLKQLIELGVQQQAFPAGREAEEIRALWRAAHQKLLLDEAWLHELVAPPVPIPLFPRAETSVAPTDLEPAAFVRFQNLPPLLAPLIGREQQEQAISALLLRPEVRLLTLTGTAGIGKTRLAQKVATDLSEVFTHGVCLVQLAPINDPDLVVPSIAQTLGLRDVEERLLLESLKAFLRDKHLLLLLDNFEQVLEAAPALVELLLACPSIKILVTSRAVLHVEGEYEFSVPPLSLPDPLHLPAHEELLHYAAVALFVQRAQMVRPNFVLSEDNAAAIAKICIRLDGLPLSLELAAARSKLLSPQALLERLNHRLAVLTGGRQDAPTRQQTLRDTIRWSYDLLNAQEQRCFRRLAIFVGGCTLEAAEAVCSAAADLSLPAIDLVASLLDKSLLQQSDRDGDEPRLLMLETIREYALETLANSGELEATEEVHAMCYLTLAERGDPELFGHQQHLWVDRLTRDSENLRAALQWLLSEQHQESLLRLASSLGWFWYMCGRLSEGMLWLEHALRGVGQDVAISARIKALCYEAFIALHLGLIDLHTSRAQECLTLARQQRDYRCFALASWSLVHYLLARGDVLQARVQAEETMAFVWIPGTRDEGWSLACALNALGSVILYQGDYAQAQEVFERATDLFKKMGDLWLYGEMHLRLADVYLAQGDEMKGRTQLDERVAIHAQADNSWATGWFLGLFGQIALRQGAIARARILLEAAMKRHQQLGDQQGQALIYALLAQVAASEHDYMLSRPWQLRAWRSHAPFVTRDHSSCAWKSWRMLSQVRESPNGQRCYGEQQNATVKSVMQRSHWWNVSVAHTASSKQKVSLVSGFLQKSGLKEEI
jgi:predicted ATPase/transcriptional regulator with XRE-family HTH domain